MIDEKVVELLAPVLFIFCLCMVAIVYFYLRSRERQMLIERNATVEEVAAYFNKPKRKTNSVILFRLGIILIFFGLAIGLGIMFDTVYNMEFMVPLLIFVFTGFGFIVAHKLGTKEDREFATKEKSLSTEYTEQ